MKTETGFNRIFNEIMESDNKAFFLLAPVGSQKSDFLTQLGERYPVTYWFNPITEDLSLYCHTLIDKILKDDFELQFKLKQLLFSSLIYINSDIVILSLLDYIKKQKVNTLMVFERMEYMPKDFDYSDFIYLIKNAPPNLKIVFSSTEFLPFEWNKFEPNYPMFIDNTILKLDDNAPTDVFLSDLTEDELAFIYYISDLDAVDIRFLDNIYPDGGQIFKNLTKRGEYIVTRDINYFRISPLLSSYLATQDKIVQKAKNKFPANIKQAYGRHLNETGHLFGSLTLFYEAQCVEGFDKSFKEILNEDKLMLKVIPYIKTHSNFSFQGDVSQFMYYQMYRVIADTFNAPTENCNNSKYVQISQFFMNKNIEAYLASKLFEFVCLSNKGQKDIVKEEFKKIHESYGHEYKEYLFTIASFLPNSISYTSLSCKELEDFVLSSTSKNKFEYIKLVEDLATAYFFLGNYRKSLHFLKILSNHLDYYIMPPHFIALYYYLGEIEEAAELVNEGLNRSIPIHNNIDILYTVKGMVEAYYGNEVEADKYFDLAYKNLDYNDSSYYLTIMQRCLYKAKTGNAQYAKDLANIHLQQSIYSQQGVSPEILSSISYALFKLENKKSAHLAANSCIQLGSSRSFAWLLGMGIATNILLEQGELKDAPTLVKNLLKASYNYGMKMVVADYADDIFSPILSFARTNGIEIEYIDQLNELINRKQEEQIPMINIYVNMFGAVHVKINEEEIKWKTKKAKDLFVQYVIAGTNGIERASIINLMWKEYLYDSAINNLKTTNNIIRNTLAKYDLNFKLEYINSKYILYLENVNSDFYKFEILLQKYDIETNIKNKIELMGRLLTLSKDEFAKDMNYENIQNERRNIKQWFIINLMRLVKMLVKSEDFVEAKRFLQVLSSIETSADYTSMMEEISSNIVLV